MLLKSKFMRITPNTYLCRNCVLLYQNDFSYNTYEEEINKMERSILNEYEKGVIKKNEYVHDAIQNDKVVNTDENIMTNVLADKVDDMKIVEKLNCPLNVEEKGIEENILYVKREGDELINYGKHNDQMKEEEESEVVLGDVDFLKNEKKDNLILPYDEKIHRSK